MPTRDVFQTSTLGRSVPLCPICQHSDQVRRLIQRVIVEGSPFWTCDDCLVSWVDGGENTKPIQVPLPGFPIA